MAPSHSLTIHNSHYIAVDNGRRQASRNAVSKQYNARRPVSTPEYKVSAHNSTMYSSRHANCRFASLTHFYMDYYTHLSTNPGMTKGWVGLVGYHGMADSLPTTWSPVQLVRRRKRKVHRGQEPAPILLETSALYKLFTYLGLITYLLSVLSLCCAECVRPRLLCIMYYLY